MGQVSPNPETAKRAVQRIARIERRLRQIDKPTRTGGQDSEISALKWALPILREYIEFKYGKTPPKRAEYWKHEYIAIKDNLICDYGRVCYICQKPKKRKNLTVDHFIPLDKGGTDKYENYRLACMPCNVKKGSHMPEDYFGLRQD